MSARNFFVFTVCLAVVLGFVVCHGDENDEDPYTTTDPKKREPSPCESEFMKTYDQGSY